MELLVNFEYLIAGALLLVILSIGAYKTASSLLSNIYSKHTFVFIDENGKVTQIVTKRIRKGKNSVRIKGIEYNFEPNAQYHLMSFDEKNELVVKKDRTIDSAIKGKLIEEYEMMALSLLSRMLHSKLRGVDIVMLLMMGLILVVILSHFMRGG